jgi:hypothetical protein
MSSRLRFRLARKWLRLKLQSRIWFEIQQQFFTRLYQKKLRRFTIRYISVFIKFHCLNNLKGIISQGKKMTELLGSAFIRKGSFA